SLYTVFVPITPYIIRQNTYAEIDIVFNFEDIDTFFIDSSRPSRNMNLHNADRIASRNRERIAPTLDDDNTRDEARINAVLPGVSHDRFGTSFPAGAFN